MEKFTLLCVDDEPDILDALFRQFRLKYHVLKAKSGDEALNLLDKNPDQIAVILADQRMPGMSGTDFLSQVITKSPNSIRIVLTGYSDLQSITTAINQAQIFRYVTKPWDPSDLDHTVSQAIERYSLQKELNLKQEALEKAYTELKNLDTAKNNFMMLINHELKTPLTAILSYGQLLAETQMDEEQNICVDRMMKASNRLRALIDDTLLIVKNEAKLLSLNTRSLAAEEFKNTLTIEIMSFLKQKEQKLKINVNTDKKFLGDYQYLKQVIERLIHNASKFGDPGHNIQIEISSPTAHRVEFSVMNKGKPISDRVIQKILNPFFLDEDVMNHSTGTGLGLTVCQSILKAHRSELQIRNTSDGVRVSFQLHSL